jgi:MSHA biogenesis protein MshJ
VPENWKMVRDRIDRMTLRERIIFLAAAIGVVFLLIDTLLVSPVLVKRKAALEQHARQELELRSIGTRLQALARSTPQDPDSLNRARIAELNAKLAALDADIKSQSALVISAERMRAVLQQLLASRPGLELVELKTLPQSVITTGRDGSPAGSAVPSAAIYKHGVQLSVRGRYLDLLAYLKSIEQMPVRLYWDKLDAVVVEHPMMLMHITLYTVSLDKAWMQV